MAVLHDIAVSGFCVLTSLRREGIGMMETIIIIIINFLNFLEAIINL